jgi:hypothetical protein
LYKILISFVLVSISLTTHTFAQTYFGDPPPAIEYELDDIFDELVKPILEENQDDILDTLGIYVPENFEDGIQWVEEHPIGGGVIIGGVIGTGVIGVETGIIDSIPIPDIDVIDWDLPNGGTVDGTIGGDLGIDDDWNLGESWSIRFNLHIKF